ncbi:hypothetical protein DPEC_G00118790 [Dallia pectoralis]|uniref:Uncharacterized protein n=1 Tax=Dallia pectoralis TaxID=75939 RepID=A0ACC2GP84_DALPE|nr:hypothetical protein DPEC_G00118790 [Dallia pectoralis]
MSGLWRHLLTDRRMKISELLIQLHVRRTSSNGALPCGVPPSSSSHLHVVSGNVSTTRSKARLPEYIMRLSETSCGGDKL